MDPISIAKVCSEAGLSIGIFALCCWLVMFIVKKMASSLDKLTERIETSTNKIKIEHENFLQHLETDAKVHEQAIERTSKQHEGLMRQHEEMIKSLARINGYK